MTAAKKAAETNGFEAMTSFNPEAFKEGYEKFAEGVSTIADFNKGSLEALMASAGAFTKGFEKLASEHSAFVKASFEESAAVMKAASTSKTAQEIIDINSKYARESLEKNLGQVNKVAEMLVETTKQTVEPLTSRYSDLVEKIQSYRP